jgi:hypothetical protein
MPPSSLLACTIRTPTIAQESPALLAYLRKL